MKRNAVRPLLSKASLLGFLLMLALGAPGDNIWLSPASGLWNDATNWSRGSPPGGTNITTVWITNANSKVVTIDAATPATNLLVTRLNLWGGSNSSTNILSLTGLGANNPLTLSSPGFVGQGGGLALSHAAVLVQNSLTISNGASLALTNSALVVTGNFIFFNLYGGSATLDSGSITVGDSSVPVRVGRSTNATLTINGGVMQVAGNMILGDQFNHSQGTLNMSGGLLALSSPLSLGDGAGSSGLVSMTGGQLVVTNSGTNGLITVGAFGQGQMFISSNSIVTISSELNIGDEAGSTGLVSVVGGQLTVDPSSTNVTRIGNYGTGQLIVTNATVILPDTSVGRHTGSRGAVTLQDNALLLVSDDFSIGRFGDPVSSAQGNVLMTGGQLVVTNINTSIWVGREGIGEMSVSNGTVQARGLLVAAVPTNTASGTLILAGGNLLISSNVVVGDAGLSTGKVFIVGGRLNVTNETGSASLEVPGGMMTLSGGTVETDLLRLTNSGGQWTFNSGTLLSGSTFVSNTLPFIIGDGTNAATFQLRGGTHYFANGLTISSNATLSGCGTIIGPIVNQGTIATNCGAVSGPPSITQQPVSLTVTQGATASFSVTATGTPPPNYQWRFSGLPGDIPGATNSTLDIPGAQGTNAGNYRVMVSNTSGSVTSVIASLRVLIPAAITNASLVGANFSFSFSTVSGLNYSIEYKTNLSDAIWTPLATLPGNGAVLPFNDPVASVPSRFYRLRVQ